MGVMATSKRAAVAHACRGKAFQASAGTKAWPLAGLPSIGWDFHSIVLADWEPTVFLPEPSVAGLLRRASMATEMASHRHEG